MGKARATEIEASETYLERARATSQITSRMATMAGVSARITPAAVETPLPPEKRKKMDQLWPRITTKPESTRI